MGYDYDKLFATTPQALGDPGKLFTDFFRQLEPTSQRVLDIGCGQGRDALFIARLGHSVVGVDISPNGISDLKTSAQAESLAVRGIVCDLNSFEPEGEFDILLCDRALHMLSAPDQIRVLGRLIDHVDPKGWVLIADERSNIQGFRDVFDAHSAEWSTRLHKGGTLFMQRN